MSGVKLTPQEGDKIDVWFSCGAASAVAAMLTVRRYGNFCDVRILNNPVAEEDADNRRFLADVSSWISKEILDIRNPLFPNASAREVWTKKRYMAGVAGAPCTEKLKRNARQAWEATFPADWMVMGFTADEERRHKAFTLTERKNVLPVLIEAGLTKEHCFQIITDAGIDLPLMYRLGYPNANCIGCVKVTSPTYWNHVRKVHPDVFADRAAQSRELGVRLVEVHKKRIFLDELDPAQMGRAMKQLKAVECGLFCEEQLVGHRDLIGGRGR